MFQINDLTPENLWDVASFCLKQCEKEDWYCKGDRKRISEAHQRIVEESKKQAATDQEQNLGSF